MQPDPYEEFKKQVENTLAIKAALLAPIVQ
jgi:hypothetical protein